MGARPDWAFLRAHPAHVLALGFGSGLAPKAPGTFGSLAAWALYWPLAACLPGTFFFVFLAASFLLGVWVCGRTATDMGAEDPGAIVWDEMVAVWLVLALTPSPLLWQALAVALFRLFDITKPPPVRQLDRALHGGLGVMMDDLAAAAYALLVLLPLVHFGGQGG